MRDGPIQLTPGMCGLMVGVDRIRNFGRRYRIRGRFRRRAWRFLCGSHAVEIEAVALLDHKWTLARDATEDGGITETAHA